MKDSTRVLEEGQGRVLGRLSVPVTHIGRAALREMQDLEPSDRRRIIGKLAAGQIEVEKVVKDQNGLWRAVVGDYRVVVRTARSRGVLIGVVRKPDDRAFYDRELRQPRSVDDALELGEALAELEPKSDPPSNGTVPPPASAGVRNADLLCSLQDIVGRIAESVKATEAMVKDQDELLEMLDEPRRELSSVSALLSASREESLRGMRVLEERLETASARAEEARRGAAAACSAATVEDARRKVEIEEVHARFVNCDREVKRVAADVHVIVGRLKLVDTEVGRIAGELGEATGRAEARFGLAEEFTLEVHKAFAADFERWLEMGSKVNVLEGGAVAELVEENRSLESARGDCEARSRRCEELVHCGENRWEAFTKKLAELEKPFGRRLVVRWGHLAERLVVWLRGRRQRRASVVETEDSSVT